MIKSFDSRNSKIPTSLDRPVAPIQVWGLLVAIKLELANIDNIFKFSVSKIAVIVAE